MRLATEAMQRTDAADQMPVDWATLGRWVRRDALLAVAVHFTQLAAAREDAAADEGQRAIRGQG